ncbi:MAG: DNA-J related domain-containing protein [Spirochaetota bacterium]
MYSSEELGSLYTTIVEILRRFPSGISEYNLLKELATEENCGFTTDSLAENFTMFQTHFLLFHVLYKLKDHLETHKAETLEIHCLKIQLHSLTFTRNIDNLVKSDPLKDYYLDLQNLQKTTEDDVEELLKSFWMQWKSYQERNPSLQVLGLPEDASTEEIEKRYRILVKKHHPDKGGNPETFQKIQTAMEHIRNS